MSNLKLKSFEGNILFFNGMYNLPIGPYPTAYEVIKDEHKKNPMTEGEADDKSFVIARLMGFKKTVADEVTEVDDIIKKLSDGGNDYSELDMLVDLADWLGDIQVYCASEMAKFGLPIAEILSIIMASNFSKLQADGTTAYDENGKVQKGPGYWKPEPQIRVLLEEYIANAVAQKAEDKKAAGIITPDTGEVNGK